jgi:asparagine synthase (glutamine-hydrolysing)
LIRCSAFCLSLDEEHSRRAADACGTIDRVRTGAPAKEGLGRGVLVALPLEGVSGMPVVHGWMAPRPADGEFSLISEEGGRLLASRDLAGTRPLFVAKSGLWVSSDHRFFPQEEAELLSPGSTYDVSTARVRRQRRKQADFKGSFEEAGSQLASLFEKAVEERVAGKKRVAVAFSGGLDSSLLAVCAKKHSRVLACSVYAHGSRDSVGAPAAADLVGAEPLLAKVDERTVKDELPAIDLPFWTSPMDRSLWCIYSIASRIAAEAGAEVMLLGQLADELFGGYMKYERILAREGESAAASLMQEDVDGCGRRGFLRDEAACSRWLEPRFPFADRRVLEFGLRLPVAFKIRRGVRKAVLREAAVHLGVPEELRGAPKKAAQYSSGILKMMN